MMQSAGHTLISSLITPIHSVILKKHGRLSPNLIYGNRTKPRKLHQYHQKCQFHKENVMVASRYPPPWFSIAPMMDYTDNHYRTLARLISKNAWLYTEMIAAETIVFQKGNLKPAELSKLENLSTEDYLIHSYVPLNDRFLAFSPEQHPIVLQIGGNDLDNIAKATQLANPYGYDEINLNCGCPSPKVAGKGCFGVRLMLDPKFVADAMSVISANTNVPVSVKCRIGVDDHDSYNELCDFIYKVSSQSPTKHFIIHSRKALLNGISPKENRSIPPLKYEYYYALVRDFPDLQFTINGGINTIDEGWCHISGNDVARKLMDNKNVMFKGSAIADSSSLKSNTKTSCNRTKSQVNAALREGAHGVMVGRAASNSPWNLLGHVDSAVYGAPPSSLTRRQVLEKYLVYGDSVLGLYGPNPNVREVIRPLLSFFHSEPGNGPWKRKADAAFMTCTTIKAFFEETLVAIPDSVLDSPITRAPVGFPDVFADAKSLLPPTYTAVREEELLYA